MPLNVVCHAAHALCGRREWRIEDSEFIRWRAFTSWYLEEEFASNRHARVDEAFPTLQHPCHIHICTAAQKFDLLSALDLVAVLRCLLITRHDNRL
jgi:hypothetical protein